MMTQMKSARDGIITREMTAVAISEQVTPEFIRERVANGTIAIPANIHHTHLQPVGVGRDLRCKINANLGNSPLSSGIENEIDKLETAIRYGADAVMDLSTGDHIDKIRTAMIEASSAPLGTVPIYEILEKVESIEKISPALILDIIEKQASQGVDFMTIHCGFKREMIPMTERRLTGIVSRGGAIIAQWMRSLGKENPFYTLYDDILEIAARYDVTLSLGDGLRPGSLADASDDAQFAELSVLGELTERAWEQDVQIMVEGPGHIPFHEITENVSRQMETCKGAPFYVLGPIVTDIAAGYDHIASAIGGTMAATAGAAMLCYVTPKEHLSLPDLEDVRAGVIAHKIAAHAADVATGKPGARDVDDQMSRARVSFDWEKQFELALDSDRARDYRGIDKEKTASCDEDYCTMCGPKFCAMKIFKDQKPVS